MLSLLDFLGYLAEKSRDVFWIRNIDYSKQIYISPAYEKIWGRSVKELYENPKKWYDYLHPEDRNQVEEKIKGHGANVTEDESITQEYRIVQPDGIIAYIREESFPVFKNSHLLGFCGISQDITKEKENAFSLQAKNDESLIYIKNIIDNVPHSIFWKDSDSRFLGCNQAFATAVGLTDSSQIIGKTDYDFSWGKDEAAAYRDDDKQVINSGFPKLNIEETQTTQDGKKNTLLTSKVPLVNHSGEVFGVLGIYTDITHLKQIEKKLLEANKLSVKQECNNNVDVTDPVAIVLIVEDNPLAAYVVKNLLKNSQCAADVVTNGEDAVKKSQEKEYHFILMDIDLLPGIDGIEATRRIRKHLDAKTTPIIAVTGHVEVDKKQQCLEAGMQDVFNKPLDIPGLQKILGKYRFNVRAFEPLETIDLKDGARLIGGSVDSAKEMLGILIKDLERDLKEIKDTADANNMNQLYDLIHRLYGGLCYCGVPRLRFLAKQLKEALLAKTYNHIIGYVNALVEEGQNVLKEVRAVL